MSAISELPAFTLSGCGHRVFLHRAKEVWRPLAHYGHRICVTHSRGWQNHGRCAR